MRNKPIIKTYFRHFFLINIFFVDGSKSKQIFLDLKRGDGSIQQGSTKNSSDVEFEMNLEDFVDMFHGKFSPTSAFMAKKLQIRGNMQKALLLESVMKKIVEQQKSRDNSKL